MRWWGPGGPVTLSNPKDPDFYLLLVRNYQKGVAAVLSESALDQQGPKWSQRPFWSKWPPSELDLISIHDHFGRQNGLGFWHS